LGVEPGLAVAGVQGMAVQDDDALAAAAREALQAAEEVDLLAGVERFAEAADFAEGARLAKDEGARRPARRAAEPVPARDPEADHRVVGVDAHRGAAGQRISITDGREDIREKLAAR